MKRLLLAFLLFISVVLLAQVKVSGPGRVYSTTKLTLDSLKTGTFYLVDGSGNKLMQMYIQGDSTLVLIDSSGTSTLHQLRNVNVAQTILGSPSYEEADSLYFDTNSDIQVDITPGGAGEGDLVIQFSLVANSVGNTEMADNAIGNSEMADSAIGSVEIIDGAIDSMDVKQRSLKLEKLNSSDGSSGQIMKADGSGGMVWGNDESEARGVNFARDSKMLYKAAIYKGYAYGNVQIKVDSTFENPYSKYAVKDTLNTKYSLGQDIVFDVKPSFFSMAALVYPEVGFAAAGGAFYVYKYEGGSRSLVGTYGTNWNTITQDSVWQWVTAENIPYTSTWDSVYVTVGGNYTDGYPYWLGAYFCFNSGTVPTYIATPNALDNIGLNSDLTLNGKRAVIKANAVTSSKIADGTIASSDLSSSLINTFSVRNVVKNPFMRLKGTYYLGYGAAAPTIIYTDTLDNPYSSWAIKNTGTDYALGQIINLTPKPSTFSVVFYLWPEATWVAGPTSTLVYLWAWISGSPTKTFINAYGTMTAVTEEWNTLTATDIPYQATWDSIYVDLGGAHTATSPFWLGAMGVYPSGSPPSILNSDYFATELETGNLLATNSSGNIYLNEHVRLLLPDTLYCAATDTTQYNVYWDNVTCVPDYHDYIYDVTCDSGISLAQGWQWTPAAATTGDYPFILEVFSQFGESVALDTMTIHVESGDTTTTGLHLMPIGDSITADSGTKWVTELHVMGGDSLLFSGTQGVDPVFHEGYSGKTYAWFENNASSPFYNGGNVDFPNYIATAGVDTPDVITIGLGTNDIFYSTDDDIISDTETALTYADSIINSIFEVDSINIGIFMIIPPVYSQDGFGVVYENGNTRWQYKKNQHTWNEAVKAKWGVGGTDENSHIFIVPTYLGLDSEHNFPTASVAYNARNATATYDQNNNGVHPAQVGYWQIADFVYGWLVTRY